jgi:hypothetical protein
MTGPSPVVLVAFAFVRIATHPRVFHEPLTVAAEGAAHVRSWLGRCHVQRHEMLPEVAEIALSILETAGTACNLAI